MKKPLTSFMTLSHSKFSSPVNLEGEAMNVCFYCKTPVPGDCVVRVRMCSPSDAIDNLTGKISDAEYDALPQLCFHPYCARIRPRDSPYRDPLRAVTRTSKAGMAASRIDGRLARKTGARLHQTAKGLAVAVIIEKASKQHLLFLRASCSRGLGHLCLDGSA